MSGTITTNTTWTSNNIYLLSGFVYVDNGATLTIQPGTIIKGDKATKGTLIIRRGSKIIADGTPTQPIVFTSNEPVGARARGDWGGLIICGYAPENVAGDPTIEGGVVANYGGGAGTANPADDSGILRYVRIEFPGIPLLPGNEINGLTLGGVGSGTTIDYVQVAYSGDDSFEFFGGTVNAKHLIALGGLDDDFDTDNGYNGKLQYVLGLRDPGGSDQSGSNGFESDNDANGSNNTPRTAPVFSNVTLMLPSPLPAGNLFRRAMHVRRNSALSAFNSVFAGYPTGFLLDAGTAPFPTPNSETNATDGSLVMKNNVIAGSTTNFSVVSGSTFNLSTFWNDASRSNMVYASVADLSLNANNASFVNNLAPNFELPGASPLATGADFTDTKLGGGFFDNVSFRGAFGTTNWAAGWSNFNPNITCYNAAGATLAAKPKSDQLQSLSVAPNPSAGEALLSFELRRPGTATIQVLDVTGRVVAVVTAAQKFGAGAQQVALPAALKSGLYVASITTEETAQSVRFVVSK